MKTFMNAGAIAFAAGATIAAKAPAEAGGFETTKRNTCKHINKIKSSL